MKLISVTPEVSQLEMSVLNFVVPEKRYFMYVTPEVSQLEMSALKFAAPEKRKLMSVIRETSQPAMGPYFFSALARSLSKALTAFFSFLLVKVPGGAAGGDDGDGEGQFFFTHLSNFFVHFLHFLLPASTPVARRSETRSMIMSFIVCALCVPAAPRRWRTIGRVRGAGLGGSQTGDGWTVRHEM